jgi:diadenosine tetraphosphatase ApaH/serine/threonine PP2A family protein phosphatase
VVARLALLYDVHGNLPALEAVLADARAAGAERFLLGGDYALFGPWPAETVAALRALPDATWIRGNVDRWCARPDDAPDDELLAGAIADCRRALGEPVVEELGALPEQLVEGDIRFCHASPLSDVRSFMPEPGSEDEELLAGAGERIVVFGHTHLQFARLGQRPGGGGVELLNPGSVGMPLDGDHRAAYALLDDLGGWKHRRVAYDHEASAAAVASQFGGAPWAERSARRLTAARLVD